MAFYHIIILALIQGLTEFLPVSSSGHLVLFHDLIAAKGDAQSWNEDLTLDVAVHMGTLFAVLLYFRADLVTLLCGLKAISTGNMKAPQARLGFYILLGSLPVILAGWGLYALKPQWLRSVPVIGWTTLLFGILLWAADRFRPQSRDLASMGFKEAAWIGLAQALALIPGVSRSGITMTAARLVGFTRLEAARFSLLLAIVAISGAGTLGGLDLLRNGDLKLGLEALSAMILSFLAGLGAIALMMRWLTHQSFTPFALYRVVLGGAILALFYAGILG